MAALWAAVHALQVTSADHENRLTALETDQRRVFNVYDGTGGPSAAPGTRGVVPVVGAAGGGVYPKAKRRR